MAFADAIRAHAPKAVVDWMASTFSWFGPAAQPQQPPQQPPVTATPEPQPKGPSPEELLAAATEQRRVALEQVDAAIGKVEAALLPITGTIAATPSADALVDHKRRRDLLANATGLETIKKETDVSAKLIKDVTDAEAPARAAADTWRDLGVRKTAVEQKLAQAKVVIGKLTGGTKSTLEADHGAAEKLMGTLPAATDLAAYEGIIGTAETDTGTLMTSASGTAVSQAEQRAADALVTLGNTDSAFMAESSLATSPVSAVLATLGTDKGKADKLADSDARIAAYNDVTAKAGKAATDGNAALDEWRDVGLVLDDGNRGAKQWIDALRSPDAALGTRLTAAEKTHADLPGATDLAAFESGVTALELVANKLLADAQGAKGDERKLRAEQAIATLTPDATGKPFAKWLTNVKAAKNAADSEADGAKRAADYVDVIAAVDEITPLIKARKNAEGWFTATKAWIDGDTGSEKTRLEGEFAALETDLKKLETETDRAKYSTEVSRLVTDVGAIYDDARATSAPVKADKAIATLTPKATGKPFAQWLTQVKAARQAAGLETDVAKRTNSYTAVTTAADAVTAVIDARKTADQWFTATKDWIDDDTGAEKSRLQSELGVLEADLKKLENETDRGKYDAERERLVVAVQAIYDDAQNTSAPVKAPKAVSALDKVVATFAKIKEPNPVKTEHQRLATELASAGSLAGTAKTDKLKEIRDDAWTAASAGTAKSSVDRKLHLLGPLLDSLTKLKAATETDDPAKALRLRCSNEVRTIGYQGACAASDVAGVIARFKTLEGTVATIEAAINDAKAARLKVGEADTEVTRRLQLVKAALDKITNGTAFEAGRNKKTYTDEHAALVLAQQNAATLTPEAAKKKKLYELLQTSIDLLQRLKKDEFAAKAATPEGRKKIEEEIAGFGTKTARATDDDGKKIGESGGRKTEDPAEQAVCKAALQACFKLDVEIPPGMSVNSLPTIFKLFAKVPPDHLGHDALSKLEYETDPDMGSSYHQGNKIVLNKIASAIDSDYEIPMLDQTDPTKSKKVMVNYLKATTLHEIGHGVDAKGKVMSTNMAAADFGGWKKETVDSVATAVHAQWFASFKATKAGFSEADLLGIVRNALSSAKLVKPTAMSASDWEKLQKDGGFTGNIGKCMKMGNADTSPWDKPAPLPDGRCYHEGYAGDWFSYIQAQRTSKGVSNYQWRAPAEWFAELYALHHLKGNPVPDCVKGFIEKKTT